MTLGRVPPVGSRARNVLFLFGFIALIAIVLLGANAFWLCDLAVYSCPANGCDGVPAQNCHASLVALEWGGPVLVILVAVALLIARRAAGRDGGPTPKRA